MRASMKPIAIAALSMGLATLVSCNVFAAGYEKAVLWSGHYGGLGGAGTSDVSGAEAIYFNPAGIGMDHVGHQVQMDVSPTWIDSSATINTTKEDSKSEFLPPYALIYDWTPNEKWGFAIGSYSGGGLADEYDLASGAKYKTSIREYEFVVGASYKVMPHWSVGADYRLGYVTAEFEATNTTALQDLRDLKGWASSWRVGTMWTEARWGAGLSVRGPADFSTTGTNNTTLLPSTNIPGTGVTVKTQLPLEASVGGHYDFMTHLRGYLEYAYTHYKHDSVLTIDGNATATDISQRWHDQHQVRVAGEWTKWSWPVRLGYVYSTAVENKDTQLPNFAPPGDGHTFTIGTGHSFWGHWQADGAFEYSYSKASGVTGAATAFAGEDKANVYALHLGLAYNF